MHASFRRDGGRDPAPGTPWDDVEHLVGRAQLVLNTCSKLLGTLPKRLLIDAGCCSRATTKQGLSGLVPLLQGVEQIGGQTIAPRPGSVSVGTVRYPAARGRRR